MTQGQALALGLIFSIVAIQWILPDKSGNSKLLNILKAATTTNQSGGSNTSGSSGPSTALVSAPPPAGSVSI